MAASLADFGSDGRHMGRLPVRRASPSDGWREGEPSLGCLVAHRGALACGFGLLWAGRDVVRGEVESSRGDVSRGSGLAVLTASVEVPLGQGRRLGCLFVEDKKEIESDDFVPTR